MIHRSQPRADWRTGCAAGLGQGIRLLLLASIAGLGVLPVFGAGAGGGLLVAAQTDTGEALAAVECRVAPRPTPFAVGTAGATVPPVPVTTEGPYVPPPGDPADEATVAAIAATVRESTACVNAGDTARLLALFTDERVARLLSGPRGFDPAAVEARAAGRPEPLPEGSQVRITGIETARALRDGRVAAIVSTAAGDPAMAYTDDVFFAQVDDRWLIDDAIPIDPTTQVEGGPITIP